MNRPPLSIAMRVRGGNQLGRTLIELLIAIVLSLMILAAVGSLYYFTSRSTQSAQQVSSAEERGRLAAFYLSEPIALAGYGNINSSEVGRRLGNIAMQGPSLRACENGRFLNMPSVRLAFPTVDFTCVQTGEPGDALFVSFQAESTVGAPQGALTDCLGQGAPLIDGVPTVRNAYSINLTGGGALEFGCVGNGGVAWAGLARDVQDFKVYLRIRCGCLRQGGGGRLQPDVASFDDHDCDGSEQPVERHAGGQSEPAGMVAGESVEPGDRRPRLPGGGVDGSGRYARWSSHFKPCPTTPAEVATGTAEVAVNDGIARRTINQVFTLRARAQAAAGTTFAP